MKRAHQDVQLVDIDGDWDLDFFGPNRATNGGAAHYLMLNDGTGGFSDASGLIPNTSGNVYEAEVSDLDNDGDVDLFFVSVQGFGEGAVFNQLADSGSLGFVKGPSTGGDDDNEVVMLDHDMDGDLDAVIGSLGNREKIVVNNGNGTYSNNTSLIQTVNDSSLDATAVDLDNDGDYDLVTAQGESSQNQWNNKLYVNSGAADTLAPVIVRHEALAAGDPVGPWVVRSEVRDQVMDDGENWVTAEVSYRVDTAAATGAIVAGEVLRSGVGMYRFEMADTAAGAGKTLVYELNFTDYAGNVSSTGPISVPIGTCGYESYGAGASPANTLVLAEGSGPGSGTVGGTAYLEVSNPLPAGVLLALSRGRASAPLLGGVVLINLAQFIDVVAMAPAGAGVAAALPIPNNPAFAGIEIATQAFGSDPSQAAGFAFSNGVALTICP